MTGFWAAAESVSLTPAADTTIFAHDPDNNMGAERELILGAVSKNAPANKARLLIRFDLTSLPPTAVVTNVTLSVSVIKEHSGAPAESVGMHPMLVDWIEGTRSGSQGSLAAVGQPTWNFRAHNQSRWGTPGGLPGTDFAEAQSSRQSVDGPGAYTFPSTTQLVADVQRWLTNSGENRGWILISENEAKAESSRRVRSRESTTDKPALTIGYTVPPPAPQIVNFDSIQMGTGTVDLRFKALAGNIYSVWTRESLDAPHWATLTNVISKLTDADALVQDPLTDARRFYQLAITGQVD